MGYKFQNLQDFFHNHSENEIRLTFKEIESIIKSPLAPSFREQKSNWHPHKSHTITRSWTEEGYQCSPNLRQEYATFTKIGKSNESDRTNTFTKKPNYQTKDTPVPIEIVDTLVGKALNYFQNTRLDANSRYRSWEHCYSAFINAFKEKIDDDTIDLLCLHLGFYLASWGMYRGSTFLIKRDYRVHRDAVREIVLDKYKILRGASCDILMKDDYLQLLFQLKNNIKAIYIQKRRSIDGKESVTDTLLSKILLGTLGCVPAYDSFVKSTLGQFNIASRSFNTKSIFNLSRFFLQNYEFEKCRQDFSKVGLEYPPMKILDMALWQYKNENSTQSEKSKNLNEHV